MATLSDLYAHLKTLCEQWFYNKSQIDTQMSNKISKSSTSGLVKNDGNIDTNTYLTSASLTGYEQTTNKTASWNSAVNDTRYPTEKLVKDSLDLKANSSDIPTDVSDLTDSQNTPFTPKSHSHGNLTSDGKIGSYGNFFVTTTGNGVITSKEKIGNITASGAIGTTSGYIITTTTNGVLQASGSIGANKVWDIDSENYTNIGTLARNDTQDNINSAINTKLGELSSINAIDIVTTLPTASSSTMGKLYIISENSKVNVYYTEQNGTSYSWHKMDTDILDELSINWADIQNNPFSSAAPSDYAAATHAHGNLTTDGKVGSNAGYFVTTTTGGVITSKQKIGYITTGGAIGTTANKPIITTTNGALVAGNFGTSANTFCEGNDSRLSDARTPTSHAHGNISNDGKITTTGTSAGNIVITTSANAVAVDTIINVIDTLVQDLITYGSS